MANQLTESRQKHREQIDREVLAALEFELVGSIAHAGGTLTGFSMKIGDTDVLLTLRAVVGGTPHISWVGAPDMSSCLRKAVGAAYTDALKWKEDKWAKAQD